MAKSKGLGDTIAKITEATGIKSVVGKISEVTGIPCGCERRQEWLNQVVSYEATVPHETKLVSQNIDDFCEGIYIFNRNLLFTRGENTYNYKIGDKILINIENPYFNDFQQYYSLGILSKE